MKLFLIPFVPLLGSGANQQCIVMPCQSGVSISDSLVHGDTMTYPCLLSSKTALRHAAGCSYGRQHKNTKNAMCWFTKLKHLQPDRKRAMDLKTGLPPIHPRVFFWPGALDVDDGDIDGTMAQLIAETYCSARATEILRHRAKELKQTAPSTKKETKALTKAGVDDNPNIVSKEKNTKKSCKKSKDAKPTSKSKSK
eukprot:15326298-Ditylum_brightwellii.AAC.1